MSAPTPDDLAFAQAVHDVGLSMFVALGAGGVLMLTMIVSDVLAVWREHKRDRQ
jgi:hypothetical protein